MYMSLFRGPLIMGKRRQGKHSRLRFNPRLGGRPKAPTAILYINNNDNNNNNNILIIIIIS